MPTDDDSDDDQPTTVRHKPPTLAQFEELLDAQGERDELLAALDTPPGIDPEAFAKLLRGLYTEAVHRAGLEVANQNTVALAATPQSLLDMACGRRPPADNPLAALAKPSASA